MVSEGVLAIQPSVLTVHFRAFYNGGGAARNYAPEIVDISCRDRRDTWRLFFLDNRVFSDVFESYLLAANLGMRAGSCPVVTREPISFK